MPLALHCRRPLFCARQTVRVKRPGAGEKGLEIIMARKAVENEENRTVSFLFFILTGALKAPFATKIILAGAARFQRARCGHRHKSEFDKSAIRRAARAVRFDFPNRSNLNPNLSHLRRCSLLREEAEEIRRHWETVTDYSQRL